MARGRMIDNAIAQDKRINQLMDDTSRLAFTWLITFADVEGRTPGDPAVVRSILFPRREDITIAQMEGYIRQWADLGLIVWYESKDDMWIYFPAFFNHNKVNKDHEARSTIPPPPDNVNTKINQTPDNVITKINLCNDKLPLKLIKDKLIQDNINTTEEVSFRSNIINLYSKYIGDINKQPLIIETLKRADKEYDPAWIPKAFEIAVGGDHKSWSYIEGILKNWQANGYHPGRNGKKQVPRRDSDEARRRYGDWEKG
jgi:DnaD/phage-associated family protein